MLLTRADIDPTARANLSVGQVYLIFRAPVSGSIVAKDVLSDAGGKGCSRTYVWSVVESLAFIDGVQFFVFEEISTIAEILKWDRGKIENF